MYDVEICRGVVAQDLGYTEEEIDWLEGMKRNVGEAVVFFWQLLDTRKVLRGRTVCAVLALISDGDCLAKKDLFVGYLRIYVSKGRLRIDDSSDREEDVSVVFRRDVKRILRAM